MSEIVIFHPAGIGDYLMDLSNLYQLINSKSSTKQITYVCNEINKPLVEYSGIKYFDISIHGQKFQRIIKQNRIGI